MKTTQDIVAWQRDFFAGPSVWIVEDPDGCASNAYESKEAAALEIAVVGHKRYRIVEMKIHSLDLAERRWSK